MSFQVKGHREMQRKLREIARRHPDRVIDAVYYELEAVSTDSAENYVPVKYGTLRSSRYVTRPVRKGNVITGTVGYGGAAQTYAVSVHETPSKHDPPSWRGVRVQFHPPGRGPKYLERPLKAAVPGMAKRIAARLDPGDDR